MSKYTVVVCRISYRTHEFEVEARNKRIAKVRTLHTAYNHDFAEDAEDGAKYKIEYSSQIKLNFPHSDTGD